MKPYIGIILKDPDSAYGIVFPDAPGCFSAADEMDDVFVMAEEALAGWTDSMLEAHHPIPPTRKLSDISRDPDWTESLAESAFLIAVPAPAGSGTKQAE